MYIYILCLNTDRVTLTADNSDKKSPTVMQQGTTPPLMIPQIPAPPTISDISDTTATVSWIAPGKLSLITCN